LHQAASSASEGEARPVVLEAAERARCAFAQAMDDDFNTAAALASLFDLCHESNSMLAAGNLTRQDIETLDTVFAALGGLVLGVVPDRFDDRGSRRLEEELMRLMIDLRADFRRNRQWAQADLVRDRLAALGVKLEDKPEGTSYRLESPA